ncbi:MAG TPA: polyprenyl synthetase family protein [Ktedonobacteraceae bacterium]|nr:polyprenyl synthetase family protein [Ktedonobacteraceae bacterium]
MDELENLEWCRMSSAIIPTDQPPNNPYAAQQNLLIERLTFFLAALPPVLRADVELALKEEGKLLSRSQTSTILPHTNLPAGSWSLLTLLVAQYVSPDIDVRWASCVAIAIECFVCALDLLDDIEDNDQTPIVQALGEARVLNVSTALLALAQSSILFLSQLNVSTERIIQLLQILQEATIAATGGQHRDLLAEQRPAQDLTFEECIEIAAGKAGSLMSLACQLGAVCAKADDHTCKQFAALGELLGIAQQLDNDSHDLYHLLQDYTSAAGLASHTKSGKTDLVRKKKTLPVVLAAGRDITLHENAWTADKEIEAHRNALQEGIITTWGICLLYRERARDRLQEIEAQRPITPLLGRLLGW